MPSPGRHLWTDEPEFMPLSIFRRRVGISAQTFENLRERGVVPPEALVFIGTTRYIRRSFAERVSRDGLADEPGIQRRRERRAEMSARRRLRPVGIKSSGPH